MPELESDHPHLLLWYVSGDLPAEQRRETESHLDRCESCTREVQAIRGMLETVRAEDRAARESSRFTHTQAVNGSASRTRREGDSAEPATAPSPRAPRRWTLACVCFAAGLMLGAVIGLNLQRDPPPRSANLTSLETAVLTPPLRGGGQLPVLAQPGPWAVTVVLPFGETCARCDVSIQREDGSRLEQPASATPDVDGAFTVLIPPLEGPAALELVVEPAGAAGGRSWRYPFEVAR